MLSSIRDTNRFNIISNINLPDYQINMVFNPDSSMMYISQSDNQKVVVFDVNINKILANISLSINSYCIFFLQKMGICVYYIFPVENRYICLVIKIN